MALVTLKKLALTFIALYLARRVYWEATTGSRRRALKKRHGCLPNKELPTKNRFLVFGIDFIRRNIRAYKDHKLLEAWGACLTDNNAHTISMHVLGQSIFLTDDPENVKTILATDFEKWSIGRERIKHISAYLGKGIFTTEGAAWKHSREMLRPCFERSQVADISIMDNHTNRFMNLIPKDGTTIDLQPLFHQLTLDIATDFLFGKSTNALDHSKGDIEVEEFIKAFEYCQNPFLGEDEARFGWFSEVLRQWFSNRKFKIATKTIADFTDKIIDEEIASKVSKDRAQPDRYVFLNELLSQTSDRIHVRSELLNILLAGRDTTAALLSNVVWELSRQPSITTRLRQEVAEHIGDEVPTYQQLKDMRYLKAIINESQRLYPIVPSNSREAIEDTILPRGGGPDESSPLFIPKRAYVAYHSYSMHRRPDIFGSDADIFNPTRWLDEEREDGALRPGWAYLPFNGGPRICIGQQFALTEAMFVVVRLLQTFPVMESRDDEVWREKMSLTCTGLGGCKVGLKSVN
ncbi:putative P450 monooxygenase [Lophiotrema nucula]|uniref:Putative P450 monooxygenase n=1 Tax=Lophiotrema nucula TaxID=690887 RepID=A0A6A5YM47_9PLEO|nr:putative P450 monooxygenase [Lophiotrema nucula]